ncbi:MAG: phytoene desaturase, partial [Actinobacteria bacterium]|nr:phytoene desaturase [Actinomycetota bacterium]
FPNLSHHGTVQSITEVFGEDAGRQWHQLLTRAEAMWDASREDFIESELRSLATFFNRKTLLRDIKTIAPLTTLRQLFDQYSDNPYLRKIVDRYATYTGSDPRKVPAVLLTIAFVEEAFGAWHIAGGRRAVGITLADGQSRDADVIVVNADVEHLYGSLLPKSRVTRKPQRALRRSTPSLSGFTIQLGLRGKSDLGHHTVLFPSDYDDEFDAIFNRKQPVPDPAIYICNPRDELMTPSPNHESWFILINAPRHEPESGFDWSDKRFAEQYAGKIIDRIEARGIKVRERIEVMKIRTPADFEREVLAPAGSIYGTSSNGARSAFLRAKNRSPIQNLFCVGGSAHPGGGLPLVGISAEIVANAIEGR